MARTILTTLLLLTLLAPAWCAEADPWPVDAAAWKEAVGKTLVLEGTAANAPVGAVITQDDHTVKVGTQDAWGEECLGHRLRVSGRLQVKEVEAIAPNPKPEGVDNTHEPVYYLEGPTWTRLDD